jgi:hypothetical protein
VIVPDLLQEALVRGDDRTQRFEFGVQRLRLLFVFPEVRVVEGLFELFDPLLLLIDFKDSPSGRSGGSASAPVWPRSLVS